MRQVAIALLFTFLSTSIFAQAWKVYPYQPDSSLLTFSLDEGWHEDEPIEWWYTNAHLIGQNSGHEYTIMLTYFAYDSLIFDGFRILNIADENTGKFKTSTAFVTYPVLSQDHLEIEAKKLDTNKEYWFTKTDDSGNLLPFQYHIESQSAIVGSLVLDYDAFKPPLIVADSGYLDQGIVNYTYYYSQTGLNVAGTIKFDGVEEPVSGIAWIDRQYGNFNPNTGEAYEWFSLQLSNGMDINLWNIFTDQNEIPQGPQYRIAAIYQDATHAKTISNFDMERPQFAYTALTNNCYANQWHLTSDTLDIDLTITINSSDAEVVIPFPFLEGGTTIEGTIQGQSVTGKGFAELLHRYSPPQMHFTAPTNGQPWSGALPISWQLTNPDEGRPISYDISVSVDQANFTLVAGDIMDTTYTLSSSELPSQPFWIKVDGYSVDHTLTNSIVTEQSYEPSSVQDIWLAQKLKVGPIPAQNTLEVTCACRGELYISSLDGHLLTPRITLRKNATKQIDISNFPTGSYLLTLESEGRTFTQKWIH